MLLVSDLAANPIAQQERAWWDAHTSPECVWGAEGDGVAACYQHVVHGLGEPPTGGMVVDLGCGPGRLLVPYAVRHPQVEVLGVDVSQRMLDLVPADRPENCSVMRGDGRSLDPLPDRIADGVWSVLMFQHIPPEAQCGYIAEVGRVLRPGGRAVVQVIFAVASETSGGFLDHPVRSGPLLQVADQAGLSLVEQVHGAVFGQWSWLTFEANDRS
jgi:SAM-dependent methyltransferase